MNRRRILVLSSSHLCRNPRVFKEARTLGQAGYDVSVMSVSVRRDFESLDQEMMEGQPFRRVVLDYVSPAAPRQAAAFLQRAATWAARRACGSLGWESAQSLGPAFALRQAARNFPADLTIVHTEIPTWIARFLVRDGRRVAIDVEDWYSEDLLAEDRRTRPVRLLRRAEDFALNHCVYASATSGRMADALVAAYRCPRPIVLRNSFPLQRRTRPDSAGRSPTPVFIWFSQTIGPGRGLEAFLAAWAETKNPSQVILLGHDRPGYRAHLLGRLPEQRRADVSFRAPVKPDELPAELANHDVGLALEPALPRNKDVTISNKVFQYLNAGLALVATPTAGQQEIMHAAPGCGLVIDPSDPRAVARQLDALLGDPDRLRAMQVASRHAAERELSWEHDSRRLLAAVADALSSHPPTID